MSGSTIILITGANTGLGYEAVKALYRSAQPYTILLGCRSTSKGDTAISSLKKEVPQSSSTVESVQVDVETDDSIEKAYHTVSSKYDHLDVLINNAGASFESDMQEGKYSLREGWNKAWNVNVAGTNVMTTLFMPLIVKSKDPLLMFITSGTSALAETEIVDAEKAPALARINASPEAGWPKPKQLNPIASYRSSKTGLNMMMREWARILKNDGVKVFCISPGFLATGLNNVGADQLKKMGALDPSEGGNFIKDVVQGKRDQDQGKVIRASMIQPW